MDFKDLPSQYDHAAAEAKWYTYWEQRGYFHANADPDDKRPVYSIVIPPPNVTGALHLGHALNNTLQDILIRMRRMQGFNTLWMPGTDHAGIATQAVVERRLFEEEKKTRHDLGRDGLVKRIWQWKDQYEARILSQLKKMGCSCDWARTRFTLDDQCARAVREWFFRLFADGKIYRGKRLVNWDTFLQTAVSDDEVFHEAVKGHFWHFKYPVVDPKPGEPRFVTIATTRPETMLGDTAVAVHPDPAAALDKAGAVLREKLYSAPAKEKAAIEVEIEFLSGRRQAVLPQLVRLRDMATRGTMLELPLTGRRIPLITDEWAKPELGSGCVKITPGHDANDYDVWQRHPEIGVIDLLNDDGTLNDSAPEKYRGMTVTKAREAVVGDIEAADLLVEIEDRDIDLAHSDRSKKPIEPRRVDQWFMKMDKLAQTAMDAVTTGRVKIVPDRYAKGYLDWLAEKRDWPIGRQLWWGHRIPVWTEPAIGALVDDAYVAFENKLNAWEHEGRIATGDRLRSKVKRICKTSFLANRFVCANESDKEVIALIESKGFVRESDVLDTWFSSALWPISTMGWPEETPELKKFYPTSTLITSRDIITLWVARMVISGLYNVREVPFHEVYITPKILDGYGETMSKSKGNGVDPLDVIDKFGADALRFGLAHLTTETQDVRMPVEFECPHCGAMFPQTKENRQLARVECEKCQKPFSTQWAEKAEDKALPRGAVVSERFELGRNFANKLWNAARFSLINLAGEDAGCGMQGAGEDSPQPRALHPGSLLLEDRWLLSRISTVTLDVRRALDQYRYADAARLLYDFAWNEFCSFYVEMTKARFVHVDESLRASGSRLGETRPRDRETAQRVLAHALDVLIRLLHPMMPFLTEEVWQLLGQAAPDRGIEQVRRAEESVCIATWPEHSPNHLDATIEQQFAGFQAVLGAVREARQRQNIPFKEELSFTVRCDEATAKLLEPMQPYFAQMARATAAEFGPAARPTGVPISITLAGQAGPFEVHVDVSRFIDVAAERNRLEKDRENVSKQIKSIEAKLANNAFVEKAPAEVVQQQRGKLAELRGQLASVDSALEKLAKSSG